jgi:hypothetical protein
MYLVFMLRTLQLVLRPVKLSRLALPRYHPTHSSAQVVVRILPSVCQSVNPCCFRWLATASLLVAVASYRVAVLPVNLVSFEPFDLPAYLHWPPLGLVTCAVEHGADSTESVASVNLFLYPLQYRCT